MTGRTVMVDLTADKAYTERKIMAVIDVLNQKEKKCPRPNLRIAALICREAECLA